MQAKKKPLLERIKSIEEAIKKGREYLESGKHANWRGFRPVFYGKFKSGKVMPPHRDWVKNAFIPSKERELRDTEKVLRTLEREEANRAKEK